MRLQRRTQKAYFFDPHEEFVGVNHKQSVISKGNRVIRMGESIGGEGV